MVNVDMECCMRMYLPCCCLITFRLIENMSAPVQSCPERVFCEDTVYELPPSNASVFTLGVSQARV